MPTLKGLLCNLEWDGSEQPLKEYQTAYGDGYVETYVAVPQIAVPFSIRLRSNGYVAPGLAMFIYIDGEYQCNRNRRNLRLPRTELPAKFTNIDFRVRQKEVMLGDGTFLGKQWKFQELNVASGNGGVPGRQAPHNAEYVGTIEVVVLRCYPAQIFSSSDSSESASPMRPTPRDTHAENGETESSAISQTEETSSSFSDEVALDQDAPAGGDIMGGLFDGACDHRTVNTAIFGLDGSRDSPPHAQNKREQWGPVMTGPNTGTYQPIEQGHTQHQGSQQGGNRASSEWRQPASGPPHTSRLSSRLGSSHTQVVEGASGSRAASERVHAVPSWDVLPATIPENPSSAPSIVINVVHPPSQPAVNRRASIAGSKHSRTSIHHPAQGLEPPHESNWHITSPQEKIGSSGSSNANAGANAPGNWGLPVEKDNDALNLIRPRKDSWGSGGGHVPIPGAWQESGTGWGEAPTGGEQRNDWDNGANRDNAYGNNNSGGNGWDNGKQNSPDNAADNSWGTVAQNSPEAANVSGWDNNATSGAQQGTWESGNNQGFSNNIANTGWHDHGGSPVHDGGQKWNGSGVHGCSQKNDTNQRRNQARGIHHYQGNNGGQQANQSSNTQGRGQGWGDIGGSTAGNWTGMANPPHPPSAGVLHANTSQGHVPGPQAKAPRSRSSKPAVPTLNLDTTGAQDHWRTSRTPSARQVNPIGTWLNNTVAAQKAPAGAGWSSSTLIRQGSSAQPVSMQHQDHATSSPENGAPYLSVNPFAKPYWSKWKEAGEAHHLNIYNDLLRSQIPGGAEEPLYAVPDEVAQQKSLSHQVQTGKPIPYVHKKSAPAYLDTFDNPYAVFVFHYRSKDTIERMLNVTITETEEEEKQRLQGLSKAEIIDYLMEVKAAASSCNISTAAGQAPPAQTEHSHEQPDQQGEATIGALDLNALNYRLQNLETGDRGNKHDAAQAGNGWDNNQHNGSWGNNQQNNSWDNGNNTGNAVAGAPNSGNTGNGAGSWGGNVAQAGNSWDNVQQDSSWGHANNAFGNTAAGAQGRRNTGHSAGAWRGRGGNRGHGGGAAVKHDGQGGNQGTGHSTGGGNWGGDNGGPTGSRIEQKNKDDNGQVDTSWNAGGGGGEPAMKW